ncbi:leucine-rich repeat domain-containing protein [Roseburia sp. 499]|uniref:leucine-rich repeat domain-containing protein n=1 Tax=Roseburia sp. 499 TaxID=1261634 RepID=UPI0009510860|nr:leucine-rich repeat domain-containing protein [Roseburia sp. 499]WVK70963.1 leucine-rich repeat protein [Roseburia sp. 499]
MKMKYVKQALATVLAVTLLVGSNSNLSVQAAEEQEDVVSGEILEDQKGTVTDSGTCGENATWTYEDGVLTISGSGVVNSCAWNSYKADVTKLVISEGITSATVYSLFTEMPKLTEASLPNSLTELPYFSKCTSLKEITIPSGITSIPNSNFAYCTGLERVTAPGVTKIYDGAFKGCTSLMNANGMAIINNILVLIDSTKVGNNLVIPEGVKDFASWMHFPSSVTYVSIPSTLQTALGGLAGPLISCENLEKIDVSEGNTLYTSVDDSLLSKDKKTLWIVPKEKSGKYVVPDGVETIGYEAMSHCAYLSEVVIPASVKKIEEGGCATANATSIYFSGDAVENIDGIFYNDYYDDDDFKTYYESMAEGERKQYFTEELQTIAQKKIYYVEGTSGWDALKAKYPRVQWLTWDGNNVDAGRTVPYYSLSENGGTWDGTHYTKTDGTVATDIFFFDGSSTYYLQADGTPMKDTLTYHPDGKHIIYLDSNGHEVFNSFQYCPSVGYTCYFDSQGYLYKDQITFVGDKTYYLNANGKLENEGWFRFANGMDYGYANWDGTLVTGGFSYDPWGRVVFYHWNGMVARGLITDGQWYYLMDETDGHYLGSFPVN